MSIHIQSGDDSQIIECQRDVLVQSIPAAIHADDSAKVRQYFTEYVRSKDNVLSASFRGYPLKGHVVPLPDGYRGVVFYEDVISNASGRRGDDRSFIITDSFEKITSWNYDKEPSKSDKIAQIGDWIDISEALHSPITD